MRYIALIIGLTITSIASAGGEEGRVRCNRSGSQPELNACAIRDYQRADKALNAEYKTRMAALPAQSQEALRKEQRAWLKERDQKCREEVEDSEGGSIWPLEFYGCLESATTERTKEISAWHPRP